MSDWTLSTDPALWDREEPRVATAERRVSHGCSQEVSIDDDGSLEVVEDQSGWEGYRASVRIPRAVVEELYRRHDAMLAERAKRAAADECGGES